MEKVIKISEDTEIKVSNNVMWLFKYNNQFHKDIYGTAAPIVSAILLMLKDLYAESGDDGLTLETIRNMPSDVLENMLIELSQLELVDVVRIFWAMAKAANDNIAPPDEWFRQFDVFPLDVIIPEVVGMALQGLMSSKNWTSLQQMLGAKTTT